MGEIIGVGNLSPFPTGSASSIYDALCVQSFNMIYMYWLIFVCTFV